MARFANTPQYTMVFAFQGTGCRGFEIVGKIGQIWLKLAKKKSPQDPAARALVVHPRLAPRMHNERTGGRILGTSVFGQFEPSNTKDIQAVIKTHLSNADIVAIKIWYKFDMIEYKA